MPKIKRNPQFKANEERIRQHLSDRKLLPTKKGIHIEEFSYVLEFLEQEAGARELEVSQMIRWLIWWFVKSKTNFPVEIETYKPREVTAEDLGMTQEQFNIEARRYSLQKNNA